MPETICLAHKLAWKPAGKGHAVSRGHEQLPSVQRICWVRCAVATSRPCPPPADRGSHAFDQHFEAMPEGHLARPTQQPSPAPARPSAFNDMLVGPQSHLDCWPPQETCWSAESTFYCWARIMLSTHSVCNAICTVTQHGSWSTDSTQALWTRREGPSMGRKVQAGLSALCMRPCRQGT